LSGGGVTHFQQILFNAAKRLDSAGGSNRAGSCLTNGVWDNPNP